jgi:hypothetical protein
MKRRVAIILSICTLAIVAYLTASKWLIRHEALTSHDILRDDRRVAVDVAVRRDRAAQATAEMIELPVVIISHGTPNTLSLPTPLPPAAIWSAASSTTSKPTSRW